MTNELIARLDAAAGRIGINRAALVRFLTVSWLDAYERGDVDFAPDWKTVSQSLRYKITVRRNELNEPLTPASEAHSFTGVVLCAAGEAGKPALAAAAQKTKKGD